MSVSTGLKKSRPKIPEIFSSSSSLPSLSTSHHSLFPVLPYSSTHPIDKHTLVMAAGVLTDSTRKKLNVLMVGAGEYTTGYTHQGASQSDKSKGVVFLVLADMR